MNEKILEYIEDSSKKGFSPGQIKDTLLKAGYTIALIDEHLNYFFKKQSSWKLPILAITFLVLVMFSIYLFTSIMISNEKLNHKTQLDDIDASIKSDISQFSNETIARLYREAKRDYTKKNYKKARLGFEDLIRLSPERAAFYFYLGSIHCMTGNYSAANGYYQQAIKLNPNSPFNYLGLARCYLRQGREEEAKDTLSTALFLNINSSIHDDIDII